MGPGPVLGAPTLDSSAVFAGELCPKCRDRKAPRNIPRDIERLKKKAPSGLNVNQSPTVWALTLALEGALERATFRAQAVQRHHRAEQVLNGA